MIFIWFRTIQKSAFEMQCPDSANNHRAAIH
jgi:hypothetical protein